MAETGDAKVTEIARLQTTSIPELLSHFDSFVATLREQIALGMAGEVEFLEEDGKVVGARVTMVRHDGTKGLVWYLGKRDDG